MNRHPEFQASRHLGRWLYTRQDMSGDKDLTEKKKDHFMLHPGFKPFKWSVRVRLDPFHTRNRVAPLKFIINSLKSYFWWGFFFYCNMKILATKQTTCHVEYWNWHLSWSRSTLKLMSKMTAWETETDCQNSPCPPFLASLLGPVTDLSYRSSYITVYGVAHVPDTRRKNVVKRNKYL